jgi:hypothetical protein
VTVLTQNTAVDAEKAILTMLFGKIAIFSRRKWDSIAQNIDHSNDPIIFQLAVYVWTV